MVTVAICYKTPAVHNGVPVTVSYALSDDTSVNTILGIPFLKATGCSLLLGTDTMIIDMFSTTLDIYYQVPLCADRSPSVVREAAATFTSNAAENSTPTRQTEKTHNIDIGYGDPKSANLASMQQWLYPEDMSIDSDWDEDEPLPPLVARATPHKEGRKKPKEEDLSKDTNEDDEAKSSQGWLLAEHKDMVEKTDADGKGKQPPKLLASVDSKSETEKEGKTAQGP